MTDEISPERQRLRDLGTLLQEARSCMEKLQTGDNSQPWRDWASDRLRQAGEICADFWPERTFTSDLFAMAGEAEEGDPVSLLERLTMRISVIATVIRDKGGQEAGIEAGAEDDEVTVRRIN